MSWSIVSNEDLFWYRKGAIFLYCHYHRSSILTFNYKKWPDMYVREYQIVVERVCIYTTQRDIFNLLFHLHVRWWIWIYVYMFFCFFYSFDYTISGQVRWDDIELINNSLSFFYFCIVLLKVIAILIVVKTR